MDITEVSTMLRELAATPAPPSTVDISRAVAVGRRRRRRRRVLAGGAVGAGVAAVLAVAGLVASALPTAGPAPVPIGSGSGTTSEPATPTLSATPPLSATPTSMPATAPERFDPLVQYADFGWLPDGSVGSSVETRDNLLRLSADYVAPGEEGVSAQVHLAVPTAGRGVDPFNLSRIVDAAELVAGTPVDPVHGRPAVRLELPGQFTALRWEYAPDTWATVVVQRTVPGADADEAARRVAENVRYGINTPVRLPFTTTGVPASLPPAFVYAYSSASGWSAQVTYDDGSPNNGDWPLTITATPQGMVGATGVGEPNTSVDGHPARLTVKPNGGSSLTVFNVDGVNVQMETNSAPVTAMLSGGLHGLFRATEFYADPADWR